jgi:hypothetical protein
MRNIDIPQPCSENFQLMTPTERGAFCEKCSIDTFDFRDKTNDQIRGILKAHIGQEVCGRFTGKQLEELNKDFEEWTFSSTKSFQSGFLFALIAVFGLSLFSCADKQYETEIVSFQNVTKEIVRDFEALKDNRTFAANPAEITGETVLPEQIAYIDYEIGGAISYDYIEQPPLEPVEIIEPVEMYYGYDGGISYTDRYSEHLISTVTDEYDEKGNIIPKEYSSLTFPNPTSSTTTLEIKAPKKGDFQIDLYDMNGKFYRNIYSGEIERGTFRQEYDLSDLPTGMYLVTITSRKYKETVRVAKI